LIAGVRPAKNDPMTRFHPVLGTLDWLVGNAQALIVGSVVAAILVAIMLLLRMYGRRIVADPSSVIVTWKTVLGRILARTTILFMVAAALDTVTTYAEPGPKVSRLIDILFTIASGLQGAIWARELILGLISRRVGDDAHENALGNAMAIIRVLVSIALFAIAGILILDNLGVTVTALVAGLGIGGIAIGLAAQGIFSDLFAALSILFDKPFKRGDTIRYDSSTGTVERIGLKTTRLRSLTGEQLIMANTKLLEREIHNLAEASARRITIYLAISGENSAQSVDAVGEAAATAVAAQKGCKLARCALSGAGAGALAYELVYDDANLSQDRIAANRSAILRSLIEQLGQYKLQWARASDQPPAPLPF
jgi:small-conductance mechanosensitive channel